MTDKTLYPTREGHGDDAGCECDLVGGDPDCKILPKYETDAEYCERLRKRVTEAETACIEHRRSLGLMIKTQYERAEAALGTADVWKKFWKKSSESHQKDFQRVETLLTETRNHLAHVELERDIAHRHVEDLRKNIEVVLEDRRKLCLEVSAHLGTITALRTPQIDDKGQITWPDEAYRELQLAFQRMRSKQELATAQIEVLKTRNQRVVNALERVHVTLSSSDPKHHIEAIQNMREALLEEETMIEAHNRTAKSTTDVRENFIQRFKKK